MDYECYSGGNGEKYFIFYILDYMHCRYIDSNQVIYQGY